MRRGPWLASALTAALFVLSCKHGAPVPEGATLELVDDGKPARTIDLAALTKAIPAETFTAYDPYYGKPKTFRALPFSKVLEVGFGGKPSLAGREVLLKARDGYTVPMRPSLAEEPGAYVAFEDVDVPAWEPIGPQRANPGPFYFVWKGEHQQDLEGHPRPWQLARIEIVRFEARFPHTLPKGEAEGSLASRGFVLFRERCVKCHAINREGGRVGPELNVPKNVLEYRTEAEVRAYIKNPLSLRYGNMPPHPDLTEADLDALVGYLSAMRSQKHDADARPDGGP